MGKEFTFVHCADLHLGSRFKGLEEDNPSLAGRMRKAVMKSFERIVDMVIERRADALVISGDLYDDSNELPSTRVWFTSQLSRLDVPVFICRGNHDSKTSWDQSIPYPQNVHEFGRDAESVKIGEDIEVVGISFSSPHESRNLAVMLEGDPSRFTIACLHCNLDSVSEGYDYAPCRMQDMVGRNIDYWALGHIHKRAVVSQMPYVVYPGNIQGRSFKETGPKGAYLVTVKDRRIASCEFIPTHSVALYDLSVDIADKNLNDVISELKNTMGRGAVCRITFTGSGNLDGILRTQGDDVVRGIRESCGALSVTLIVRTTSAVDVSSMSGGKDMAAALIRTADRMSAMTKEQLVGIICQNRIAGRYRDAYMSLSEEEIRNLVTESLRNTLARMEVSR